MTSDNIITRSEAIDRKKAGLPCETSVPGWLRSDGHPRWASTKWRHFDADNAQFRIPPEPRREAQEFWLVGTSDLPIKVWAHEPSMIQPNEVWRKRVREVLPGDVTLQRMTEAKWDKWIGCNAPTRLDVIRALGLIGEGS